MGYAVTVISGNQEKETMSEEISETFVVDCPQCKAKVAAIQYGIVQQGGGVDQGEPHYGSSLAVGKCPKCYTLLAGESKQVAIWGYDSDKDEWADFVRVYPKPSRAFISIRIPSHVRDSITEADKALQANANMAACAMLGRALEGVCRNLFETPTGTGANAAGTARQKRPVMLGEGIRKLKEKGLIDERLFNWSQELHAFRNLAAHATDVAISREDAEDLQSFVYAIIEYIYDLTDRYEEFKDRIAKRKKK
jgi:hypothetical protein